MASTLIGISVLTVSLVLGPRAHFHCLHIAARPHQQAASWGLRPLSTNND